MAGSTTTTRTTSASRARSADLSVAPFQFEDLVQAYYDCRRNKRNTASARRFEKDMEINLLELHDDLIAGTYRPGRSICFVVTRPKAREVWAAAFRDRVVHHLLYNRVAPRFYASFIADSCACIPGRGTLYAATRLEAKIRSASQNWSKPCFYLKLDLANFFVAIDKEVLRRQLAAKITEPWWLALAEQILMHDPREDYEVRSPAHLFNRVPQHKRLTAQPARLGLPIGNLSSQFFANIYLDALDQFAKHKLRARGYVVENPAEHGVVEGADWADYMAYDLTRLGLCGQVAVLPGWENSKGARLEVHIARELGMPVVNAHDLVTREAI